MSDEFAFGDYHEPTPYMLVGVLALKTQRFVVDVHCKRDYPQ